MATDREIVTFDDRPPPRGASPWVGGHRPMTDVHVVAADPTWPARFASLAATIAEALDTRAIVIEHVGSTSVPDLPAKPVIDIDLTVADSADESAYVPALQRCGFTLVVREPWWNEHRLLRRSDPSCNLHVFSTGGAELERHRIFRDWLRAHPDDRSRYAEIKLLAAKQTRATGGHSMDYNAKKESVIREINDRAFRALGLLGD
jgi:GrpB-like predicted nucleotidyltransferase (UPF0157 family)